MIFVLSMGYYVLKDATGFTGTFIANTTAL
jgi:hypothetical protein